MFTTPATDEESLLADYDSLIRATVRQSRVQSVPGCDADDLLLCATVAALQAIRRRDPDRPLGPYIRTSIEHALADLLRQEHTAGRRALNNAMLGSMVTIDDNPPEPLIETFPDACDTEGAVLSQIGRVEALSALLAACRDDLDRVIAHAIPAGLCWTKLAAAAGVSASVLSERKRSLCRRARKALA